MDFFKKWISLSRVAPPFYLGLLLFFLSLFLNNPNAQEKKPDPLLLEIVEFRELVLPAALHILSEQTGLNIVPSFEAAKVKVSLLLRDVTAENAIDALCQANKLWYKHSQNGIYYIYTLVEYKQDASTLQEDRTEVFTLLYPNVVDVAVAIADLYGDRVLLSLGNDGDERLDELQERYDRFGLIGGQTESNLLGKNQGTSNGNGSSGGSNTSESNTRNSNVNRSQRNAERLRTLTRESYKDLTQEEIQALDRAIANDKSLDPTVLDKLLARRNVTIHITLLQNQNRLLIRTSDDKVMSQLRELVKKLDVPTPLVLLEVKVMQIELEDGFNSAFDFGFKNEFYSGGFTEGEFAPPATGSLLPGGTGIQSDTLIFQYVSGSFAARLQLLESQNRVTTLATPLLLTANKEVSRIFAGDTLPIVTGFSGSQTVTSGQSVVVAPGSTITQRQDIGTSLLITPSINADRTVTLQILQEISEIKVNGTSIPVATADGNFEQQTVDTIRRRTLAGTIVAKDGLAVAVGGLIEEAVGEQREQTPILGEIPFLGILFRRETLSQKRTELVITVRPYILNTAADSEQVSQQLLEELSYHPTAVKMKGTLNTYRPKDVLKGRADPNDLKHIFKYHSTEEE